MYSLERFGIKLGLEVMEALLAELGNPHRQFPSVHITGTNGKGSVAAMLESIVRAGGHTTALYTSPHLFTFNERIRVNNIPISDPELGQLITQVKKAAVKAQVAPTFFEFTTAVAFCYFAAHTPDLVIIEVGMGGLLDATNVITPLVSIITTVDLDHVPLIGKTKQEIAVNKAGIIKIGVPVVTGEADPGIIEYLQTVCQAKKTYLRITSRELKWELVEQNYKRQKFTVYKNPSPPPLVRGEHRGPSLTREGKGVGFEIQLLGRHQLDNTATALLVLEELNKQGFAVSEEEIRQGLAATEWLGRLTVVSKKPFILVDGAHNPQSLLALHGFLTDPATKPPSYDVLVVGMKNDKNISVLQDTLVPLFNHVIVTEGTYEPKPAAELAAELAASGKPIEIIPDPAEATRRGLELIGEKGSMVVTGSLYMIPAALTFLRAKLPARAAKALRATL